VKRSEQDQRPALELLRATAPGAIAAIAALLVCQALLQLSYSGSQPLIVLRLLEHLSTGVEAVTGVAFAAAGLASALASVVYVTAARRIGFRTVGVLAALLMSSALLLVGWGPGVPAIVVGAALSGLFYGTLGPVISTMIGLETPAAAQARVFGVGASATAVGFALGPFSAGVFAARLGTPAAVSVCAIAAALLAVVLAGRGREPAR
ncbi:MAG TPA: MFS transporter, partial [Candidatus Eisenbacteria bacterium]|nr:MFS transporter [Candidatus Eisenbacteria bacterium]